MKLRSALFFPVPALLCLYACATAGADEGDDDGNKPLPAQDAASDATTGRKDSGPASPPRDGGSSSGGSSSGGSSSGGSSSGGSSSSSGGGGPAPVCDTGLTIFVVGLVEAGEGSAPGVTEVDDCDECTVAEPGCCAEVPLGGAKYCYDPLGGAQFPDGGF